MTLYTTHCSRCRVLEAALKNKNVTYETCEDVDKMEELGLMAAPALEVNGKLLQYDEAMKYVMEEI